jgi:hypothetical protein
MPALALSLLLKPQGKMHHLLDDLDLLDDLGDPVLPGSTITGRSVTIAYR